MKRPLQPMPSFSRSAFNERGLHAMALIVLVAAILLFPVLPAAVAAQNPHVDTADQSSCLFCHVPGFATAGAGDSTLLEGSIEEVCVRCHTRTACCAIGQKHGEVGFIGYSHPSDLDARTIRKDSLPRSLPLQDGMLTCNTCHLHRRPQGRDYKLVRLVEFTATGVQWTNLCQDCHRDQ